MAVCCSRQDSTLGHVQVETAQGVVSVHAFLASPDGSVTGRFVFCDEPNAKLSRATGAVVSVSQFPAVGGRWSPSLQNSPPGGVFSPVTSLLMFD